MGRLCEASFEVEGKRCGVYGHDWRTEPPTRWLERIASRRLPGFVAPAPTEELVVLSEPDFKEAVREELRIFTKPHELQRSPLITSQLVARKGGGA